MPEVILPNKSKGEADDNDFSDVYENDVAIKEVVEALTDDNIAPGAGIDLSKLARTALQYITAGKTVKVNFGINNVVSEGADDGYTDVAHGLGATATFAIASIANGTFQATAGVTRDQSATTLRLYAYRTDGANLGTVPVAWLAILVE